MCCSVGYKGKVQKYFLYLYGTNGFFEFARETAMLAHKNNMKNVFVTNGYGQILFLRIAYAPIPNPNGFMTIGI